MYNLVMQTPKFSEKYNLEISDLAQLKYFVLLAAELGLIAFWYW